MTKARDLANVISGSGTLNANVIPNLPTSKITSGTFDDARLSSSSVTQHVDLTSLSASNLTSGTVPSARLSLSASDVPDLATSKITSGTFADARLSSSSVTQHVDLTALNASNLTSGTIPNARYGTPTFSAANLTSVPTAAPTTGSWTPSFSSGSYDNITGKYQKFGQVVYCQAEVRMTAEAADTTNILTFGGLPFTALTVSAGYNNQWFVGTGRFYYHSGSNTPLWVRDNTTSFHPSKTGNSAYRLTRYYATYDKGGFIESEFDNERFLYDTNSDRRWGWFDLTYLTAS